VNQRGLFRRQEPTPPAGPTSSRRSRISACSASRQCCR
jgi:hypothetical protein